MTIPAQAKSLIKATTLAVVATSDSKGRVHLASARDMRVLDGDRVAFEEWFCNETLSNLENNPHVTVGVVDSNTGKGYQLLGQLVGADPEAMTDGFSRGEEVLPGQYPQTRYRLSIEVFSVIELNTGPHSDKELD
jgi:predicted pyridoxine 5'-phosphate oxidase superfamily flavin-nucleotide-binding protein